MKFRRNLFHPIRLILYPVLIETVLIVNGTFTSEWFWVAFSLITVALTAEGVWEFVTPYVVFNGSVLEINSSLLSRKRIDLSQHHDSKIVIAQWYIQIGDQYINLRKARAGHRDHLAEAIRNYFEPPGQYQNRGT